MQSVCYQNCSSRTRREFGVRAESRLEGGLKSTSANKSFHETEDRKGLGEEECRLFDTFLEDAQRAYDTYRTQRMLQHCAEGPCCDGCTALRGVV
jgi:hypothetical protein